MRSEGKFRPADTTRGFTLLELLLAVSLLAIVTATAFVGFNSMLATKDSVETAGDRLAVIQKAFIMMGRDFAQISPRSIRDEYGFRQPAVYRRTSGFFGLEFTRNGWLNSGAHSRSNLQRVAYGLVDGALVRKHWLHLDRAGAGRPLEQIVLAGVTEFSMEFLDADGHWRNSWPPETSVAGAPVANDSMLPKALAITLDLEGWGKIKRIFMITGNG